jgi:AAA domain
MTDARIIELDIVTAAELADMIFPPVSYVVDGYIAEGLTILAGRPKAGKSWLALNFGTAVASGGMALGSVPVEAGDVLYLALEDNRRRLKRRLDQIMQGAPAPERLHLVTKSPRVGEGLVEAIDNWRKTVPRPRLIIIDVFGKVRQPRRSKDSYYDEDYRSLEPLKTAADLWQLAIVVLHHTSKREEPLDPFDAVSGTTGLTAAPDTVLILLRSSQGTTLYGRGRDIEEIDMAVSFDSVTGQWVTLGNTSEVFRSDERGKILNALKSTAAPIGPREIAAVSNMKDANVRRLLGKMVASGEIEKASYGCYRLSLSNPGNTGNSDHTQ